MMIAIATIYSVDKLEQTSFGWDDIEQVIKYCNKRGIMVSSHNLYKDKERALYKLRFYFPRTDGKSVPAIATYVEGAEFDLQYDSESDIINWLEYLQLSLNLKIKF